jgi:hypothetical protein
LNVGGPEQEQILELSLRQQRLFDSTMAKAGDLKAAQALWDRIQTTVIRLAATKVPYDPTKDSWHGPKLAVWQAAWAAGLVGLHLWLELPIPTDLSAQWDWFLRGHWPSGYAYLSGDGESGPLMVF